MNQVSTYQGAERRQLLRRQAEPVEDQVARVLNAALGVSGDRQGLGRRQSDYQDVQQSLSQRGFPDLPAF